LPYQSRDSQYVIMLRDYLVDPTLYLKTFK
jgi:hypothetical protein